MKTFVATVESGSFTAAANRLGISKKLASKYVGLLENHLGVRLLNRTTRSLSLSESGQKYFEGCTDLLAQLERLESRLHLETTALSGTLRIAAPVDYGKEFVMPIVADFNVVYPQVLVDLNLSDRFVDLAAGGFDLAIRVGRHRDSSMVSRLLGHSDIWLIASPDLLKTYGQPQDINALAHFPCILDSNMRFTDFWPFYRGSEEIRLPLKPKLRVNSALTVRQFAVEGRGIAICPEFFVADDVAKGNLVRLFPDWQIQRSEIRALYSSALHMPERLRRFVIFLAEATKLNRMS